MSIRGRKFHKKNRAMSLIKSHIYKDLYWLPGYPLSHDGDVIRWVTISIKPLFPSRIIELSAADLRQSRKTWTQLTGDYPLALPKVIENLGRWHTHLPKLITRLESVLEKGDELPTTLIDEMGAYNPDVQKKDAGLREIWAGEQLILDAFSWLNYLRPQHALRGLHWLKDQHPIDLDQRSLMSICDDWERTLQQEE